MFDVNEFKRKTKLWVAKNPGADPQDFNDMCEELIPPALFPTYTWLIEQTLSWYKHTLAQRQSEWMQESEDID